MTPTSLDELRSPNRNNRPMGAVPRVIILHATAGRSDAADVRWCCNSESKVSYHTIIGRDGTAYHIVPPNARAWHAGVSEWQGVKDVNGVSLGLAFSNKHDKAEMLTAAQIATGQDLVRKWCERYPIEEVTTHAAVAPNRKHDPLDCPNFYAPDWTAILDAVRGNP